MTYHEFCRKYPEHAEEAEERAAIMETHNEWDRERAEGKAVMRIRIREDLLFTQSNLFGGEDENKSR